MPLLIVVVAGVAHALPSLPAVIERHGRAVVRITDGVGVARGQGFFVATDGTLVATMHGAALGDEVVVETSTSGRVRGRIVAIDPPLVVVHALVQADDPPPVSLLVAKAGQPVPEWVVGVSVDDEGRAVAALGGPRAGARVPTFDLPSPPGAAVLTSDGEVIAIVVEQQGRSRVVAADAARVTALVERAGPRRR